MITRIQVKSSVTALSVPEVREPQVEKKQSVWHVSNTNQNVSSPLFWQWLCLAHELKHFLHFPDAFLFPITSFWPRPLCSLSFRPILRRMWIWLVDQVSTSQVRINKWPGLGIELGHFFFPFYFICVCRSGLHVRVWAALTLNPGQKKAAPLILPYALLILFPSSSLGLLAKVKLCSEV